MGQLPKTFRADIEIIKHQEGKIIARSHRIAKNLIWKKYKKQYPDCLIKIKNIEQD